MKNLDSQPPFGVVVDHLDESNYDQIMRPMDEHIEEVLGVDELIEEAMSLLASKRQYGLTTFPRPPANTLILSDTLNGDSVYSFGKAIANGGSIEGGRKHR